MLQYRVSGGCAGWKLVVVGVLQGMAEGRLKAGPWQAGGEQEAGLGLTILLDSNLLSGAVRNIFYLLRIRPPQE